LSCSGRHAVCDGQCLAASGYRQRNPPALAHAYCGFLFFWLWVAWREQSVAKGILWSVLIMTLGNIAMAGYLLVQLRRWQPAEGIDALLRGKHAGNRS